MTTRRKDVLAILLLVALWGLFFWRLLTPVTADQVSLKQGDFSGQFVAFAGYQYDRLTQGEIPLWNPYNNSGLPFLADTQAAVFYPPRLLTIALSHAFIGAWTYHALELEMAVHVLLYSLFMYAFGRTLLRGKGSIIGALVMAIIISYSGFISGYPPLQLAILEAGIWLPLGLLGLLKATESSRLHWRWLLFAGFALGLSWMAGHPQTSWFITYFLSAYMAWRCWAQGYSWKTFTLGFGFFGLITVGVTAVQLLPGLEYLIHTARSDMGFADKGNGFPIRDVLQLLFPGVMSLFSPLYLGVAGFGLALYALWTRPKANLFWGIAALFSLGLSFGANGFVYPALYNILPGLSFFRGQERAAYLFVNCLAILAGIGTVYAIQHLQAHRLKQIFRVLFALAFMATVLGFFYWIADPELGSSVLDSALLSAAILGASLILFVRNDRPHWPLLLIGLIVVELFTVSMNADHTYDPIPASEQLSQSAPALLEPILADETLGYRVDGFRGLTDNFGSFYSIRDMRGISPLFLNGPFTLIEPEKINPLAWELFAVRYVFSDWEQLPVESDIITRGTDRHGPVNLHQLRHERPFAHLIYQAEVINGEDFTYELLQNPNFNPRETVILTQPPANPLPDAAPEQFSATLEYFAPEQFTIRVSTPENAILSIAHPYYTGWHATLNGEPAEILRAYHALSALSLPSGEHLITFTYAPLSYTVGAVLSLFTWLGGIILGSYWLLQHRGRHANN